MDDRNLQRPVRIGFGNHLEKGLTDLFEGADQAGVRTLTLYGNSFFDIMQFSPNLDLNSGDPIGFGIPPSTVHNGRRVTAANAFLIDKPDELKVVTNALVTRVLFHCNRAVGVECAGKNCKFSSRVLVAKENLPET